MESMRTGSVLLAVVLTSCATASSRPLVAAETSSLERETLVRTRHPTEHATACGGAMTAHFYDIGQGLAVLVDLPDGKHILVDTGNPANRCHPMCADEHKHLLDSLRHDLNGADIDVLWITHQHEDHLGGVVDLLESNAFKVHRLVENGRDHDKDKGEVHDMLAAAAEKHVEDVVVDPTHSLPALDLGPTTVEAFVPSKWPSSCNGDENQCSIVLRLTYCKASILFTGDMGTTEEKLVNAAGDVTVLQVGHHASETSSGDKFLQSVRPKYAVISAGHQDDPINATYCHPRASAVKRVIDALGGTGSTMLHVFNGSSCKPEHAGEWTDIAVPATLFATERDGDVTITMSGAGDVTPSAKTWR